ncbi:apyrase isoform X1 [Ptiloglossa arizonensis]|uniref:apyrase isoform X1 n=1 Tax=Ptiloglossa arizonensis TaxID=3350558 RepID=UPI003FA13581
MFKLWPENLFLKVDIRCEGNCCILRSYETCLRHNRFSDRSTRYRDESTTLIKIKRIERNDRGSRTSATKKLHELPAGKSYSFARITRFPSGQYRIRNAPDLLVVVPVPNILGIHWKRSILPGTIGFIRALGDTPKRFPRKTIGNHEFDNGIEGIVPFLKMVKAPVVVTNIDASEEPTMEGLYTNSTILVKNGVKIGVIGVIISTTNTISVTGKLKFLDEVETVNDEAQRLKSQGVDIIIVLSHCGLDLDREMASRCPLIDLIVGGHSHTFLYSGEPPFIDIPEDEYPVVVVQENTNRTVLIVQAAAFTKYLGNLTVWFDEEGEVVDWDGNPILLDYSIEEDPEILKALEPWKMSVDEASKSIVGRSKVYLDNNCRKSECNLGNLITDAMVDTYVEQAENRTFWTYAAVACTNPGGIRSPIESMNNNITFGDLMMSQPFENTWDTLELNGSCIVQILELNGILAWSGLKVTYNLTGNIRTVIEAKIRCRACEVPAFEELKNDQWYRVVVPSFLVSAGDGFFPFVTCAINHKVGHTDAEQLAKYMKKMSPIIVGLDRRTIFINENKI